ncbi:hypothetical protein CEXT_240241 [Caerostris extrusa]|uniref:Uncharacterized protein n=1 Tax=Caerostris extrusa TaxID=172846 RepID=A0AAV4PXN4_CAEEX|nr:hypothetical protein CEXT_240241 [Caerostris extrusa]
MLSPRMPRHRYLPPVITALKEAATPPKSESAHLVSRGQISLCPDQVSITGDSTPGVDLPSVCRLLVVTGRLMRSLHCSFA